MGKLEYTIPQVSDGVYSVFLTAEDMVGNSKTISVNYTVDNTPPIVNADINPNTTSSIDFSSNRGFKIIARSSSDTKAVYANYLGSDHLLYYSNDNWTLWVSLPPVMYLGTYVISLHAIDKAGNIGTTSSFFTVFDTTGITIHKDFEQNNGVNPGSSSQGGSGSGGSGSGGSGSGGFNDYLPWILLAILIILLFVLLLLIFPILGTIIVELLVAVLDFLFFAELPGVLGLMFRLFFALTDITSSVGFSLAAISIFLDSAVGNVAGVLIGLFFIYAGFVIGPWGLCLIGLLVLMITIFFTLTSIFDSGKKWLDNLINRF